MVMWIVDLIKARPVCWLFDSWSLISEREAFGVCVPTQSVGTMMNNIAGGGERAAGAQVSSFLPAQDGQAKSNPGRRRGSKVCMLCCRVFWLPLLIATSVPVMAGEQTTNNQTAPIADKTLSRPVPNQAMLKVKPVHPFTAAEVEAMQQSCRDPAGGVGPAMVVIKPGHFMMGSDDSDPDHQKDENPKHPVTIPRPFAVSRCEITVGQFRQFVTETRYQTTAQKPPASGNAAAKDQTPAQPIANLGCWVRNGGKQADDYQSERYWDSPGFRQSEAHPVVCVSWDDAQAYVNWLSRRAGAIYRLLSEAEWEYMARAENTAPRYFEKDKQCDYANAADLSAKTLSSNGPFAECDDGFTYTAPVAAFKPNAFGLFDVLGNVSEWTADCWHEGYQQAPQDGAQSWQETDAGDCKRRVVRGGSWNYDPFFLRSAFRNEGSTNGAGSGLGFRIARAL